MLFKITSCSMLKLLWYICLMWLARFSLVLFMPKLFLKSGLIFSDLQARMRVQSAITAILASSLSVWWGSFWKKRRVQSAMTEVIEYKKNIYPTLQVTSIKVHSSWFSIFNSGHLQLTVNSWLSVCTYYCFPWL